MVIQSVQDSLHRQATDTVDSIGYFTPETPLRLIDSLHQIPQLATETFFLKPTGGIWLFVFLISLFLGYAVSRAILGRLLSSTFMAAVRYNTATSMFNDNSQLQRQRDMVLLLFYFLSTAFFLMLLTERYESRPYGLEGPALLGFFISLLIALFYIRVFLLNTLGVVFFKKVLFKEYLYMGHAYNKLLGIALLPANFILLYSQDNMLEVAWIITFILLTALLMMKIFRGFEFAFKHNVLNIYLFLYLCALEIVPVLLFYKWFTIIM